jgi:hypothetical protein
LYCNLQSHQSSSSAKLWCQLFQVCHYHIIKTCILTLYSLYSNKSHFSQNNSTMARSKWQGKKKGASKAKSPAKQGQGNQRSRHQVIAAAAAACAAAPVSVPTADGVVLPPGSLGTDAPSGISTPSATAAATADFPESAATNQSAAAAVPLPKKGALKAKNPAKGTAVASGIAAPSANAAAAVSIATASSTVCNHPLLRLS